MSKAIPSWSDVLYAAAATIEKTELVKLDIEGTILLEIERVTKENLASMGFLEPNVAKFAGTMAFWIRRLKPLRISANSPNYFALANERAALLVGLAIASLFRDESGKRKKISLPPPYFARLGCNFALPLLFSIFHHYAF